MEYSTFAYMSIVFTPLYPHHGIIYDLPGFRPAVVNAAYLKELGVKAEPSAQTLEGLERGSELLALRLQNRNLKPFRKQNRLPKRNPPRNPFPNRNRNLLLNRLRNRNQQRRRFC